MHKLSVSDLSKGLANKEFSSTELTKHFLKRINSFNHKINAFITITEEEALKEAALADNLIKQNQQKPLTGIPFAQKDIFCTNGIKTTCGSKMLSNFIAPYDATVVTNLKENQAITLGKTNMDEFAMGSSNETSYYGPVLNPWNTTTVPGGSSGGSAVAVAARLAPIATGTDTGGSIRQPAALTNLTGLKPTYGRVSRFGMVAFASSLDQAGPMGQSAEDCAIMLQALAGFDSKDSTSIDHPVPNYQDSLKNNIKGLKIGLPKEFFTKDLSPDVSATIHNAVKELEKLGATVKEISLPNTNLSIPVYYVIAPAEASSNLARYDGVRYGYRCKDPKDIIDLYKRTRTEGFGNEVKRRILIGTYVLSAGYYDAYYLQAEKVRQIISNEYFAALKEVDVIIGPTSPDPAFKLNSKKDPVSMYLNDIFTSGTNLAGLPGISVPAGFVNDLPIGMHIIGGKFAEEKLLNVAHQYQQVTDWHLKTPKEFT